MRTLHTCIPKVHFRMKLRSWYATMWYTPTWRYATMWYTRRIIISVIKNNSTPNTWLAQQSVFCYTMNDLSMLKQAYLRQLKAGDVRVIDIVMSHDQPEGQIRLRIKMANLLSMIINEHHKFKFGPKYTRDSTLRFCLKILKILFLHQFFFFFLNYYLKQTLETFCPFQLPAGFTLDMVKAHCTLWPNKNALILFGIILQKLINENEKIIS